MKDIISYHCRQSLPVFSSGDTIFISFFFIIGGIGLVCDKLCYQLSLSHLLALFLSSGVDWCSGRASGSGSMGCEFPIQYTPDAANDFLHVQRSHSNKLTLKHFCGYLVNLE